MVIVFACLDLFMTVFAEVHFLVQNRRKLLLSLVLLPATSLGVNSPIRVYHLN